MRKADNGGLAFSAGFSWFGDELAVGMVQTRSSEVGV